MSRATPGRISLAAKVRREEANEERKRLVSLGIFDRSRKIIKRGSHVEIPVVRSISGYEIITQPDPAFYRRLPDLADALRGVIPDRLLRLIPRGWFILGEVIVVKIHPELVAYENQIGKALLSYYPRCCTVLTDEGISGSFREPVRRIIAGSKTRTVHKENSVIFHLDASLVMFSPGNLRERMRMSRLGKGEHVVDMFAGIGYFTIPMAAHSRPRKITAIELNPNAYHYLCENVRQNRVEDIVETVRGDCAKVTPRGVADRVVMGMVQVTDRYLQKGISALKSGGILHYHQTVASRRFPDEAVRDVKDAAALLGCSAEIISCIRVKKYSPGIVHVVVDARINRDY